MYAAPSVVFKLIGMGDDVSILSAHEEGGSKYSQPRSHAWRDRTCPYKYVRSGGAAHEHDLPG